MEGTTTRKARLTPHQRWALLRLESTMHMSGTTFGGTSPVKWAHVRDTGSKGAMETLWDKGYAGRRVEIGERGGEHFYFTLTKLGVEEAARIREKNLSTRGR